MKVGDLVRVKDEHLAFWPEGLPREGKVLQMDESRGLEVWFSAFEQGWVRENFVEAIPVAPPPPDLAMRDNGGKPELSYALTFGEALRAMAQVCAHGAGKYSRGNYLKGAPLSQSMDCLLRHLLAWSEGEDTDPESGQGHLAHVVWNALRLCQESIVRPDLDDRIHYTNARPAP